MFKLGIVETHPIQYKVPWFRKLHAHPKIDLTVFYCMIPDAKQQGVGFGVDFKWDLPLLDGYNFEVLENISRFPGTENFSGCDTPDISSIVKHGRWDAVLVNGWVVKSCLQTLWVCRRSKTPCIVRGEANHLRRRPWWKTMIHRFLLSQYDAFISIGNSNREFYKKRGVPSEKIFDGFYCIENERFARAAEAFKPLRNEIRQSWNIPANSVCYVFSGKFIEKKRPMDILNALRKMGQPGMDRNIHVLLVGNGEKYKECVDYAKRHKLPVTFTGFLNQKELPKAYVASDCMILPSDYGETWGLVVNEAMVCGLPVIVSDQVGCHPDLVSKWRTGAVYPCGDVDALAKVMAEYAKSNEKLEGMGETAKQLVSGRYNYDTLVKGTLQALECVTSGK